MKEQLLRSWDTHHQLNILLLDNITDQGLKQTLSPRGRTIFQQLVHVHTARLRWLEVMAKDLFELLPVLDKDMPVDRARLTDALQRSSQAIHTLFNRSWDAGGTLKSFRAGLLPFHTYLVAHESHHRGNIVLTLKQSGEKLTDSIRFGLWEWGK